RRLFSSETTTKAEQELLFVLVPHIVRTQELSDSNLKGIATGNDTVIKLNYAHRPTVAAPDTPAAPAAAASGTAPAAPPATAPPVAATPPAPVTPPPPPPVAATPQPPPATPNAPARITFSPPQAEGQLCAAITV